MTGGISGSLHPRLRRAYLATRYEADGIPIRIGRRSACIDALLRALGSRQGVLITAWNPRSRRLPDGVNRRRQQRLAACLHILPTAPGNGGLRRWREDHLLVAADPRRLAVVGRRFRQRAVLIFRVGQPARLLLL